METPADPKALRRALGAFATGVTVVTAHAGDAPPVGFTANSFTSVSLDPPLLLVCLAHTSASYDYFCRADHFAVNVLDAQQEDIAMRFATRGADKFGETSWAPGLHGAPLIDGSLAQFECAMEQRLEAGDHDILMGRVLGYVHGDGKPLLYLSGNFLALG